MRAAALFTSQTNIPLLRDGGGGGGGVQWQSAHLLRLAAVGEDVSADPPATQAT